MDILTILNQIDIGSYALPEFQRGYVWNRDQVRKLMNSLYRDYPIGGLLVWDTKTDAEITRGQGPLTAGHVNLILDGQQRITTLYGIIKGKPPMFFDGNASAFTGLYFNIDDEVFEFYAPMRMADNPSWISVTELMKKGVGKFFTEAIQKHPEQTTFWTNHMNVLNKLDQIQKTDLHIQTVSGEDKTLDVVVDIFNNVNSGGTKLSKGDLALAKICGEWTEARIVLKAILERFSKAGYNFSMDWLLRCLTVFITGQAYFAALSRTPIEEIKKAVPQTEKMIGTCLDHIGTRLGLDQSSVLGGVFAICTMIGYLQKNGGKLSSSLEWDKLLYWYVHTFIWGRYAGSTESVLSQDLNVINQGDGIEGLVRLLKQTRGNLKIEPEDFWGWSTGARFYPLLYMLTRTGHARDWGSNLELSNSLLGRNSSLEVHHIFPKDILYKAGKSKSIVNSLANYAFLTKDTNLDISNDPPEVYIPKYQSRNPGAVESHWIPTDPELWKLENYEEFLKQRRILLAAEANSLLDSLLVGSIAQTKVESFATREIVPTKKSEEDEIYEMSLWMIEQGLNEGTMNHELTDQHGRVMAIIDLAWPHGIQNGLSEPIALLLNESAETQAIVSQSGYRYYTSTESLKNYISSVYLS